MAMATETSAVRSVSCPAASSRARRSRPLGSVPSGWSTAPKSSGSPSSLRPSIDSNVGSTDQMKGTTMTTTASTRSNAIPMRRPQGCGSVVRVGARGVPSRRHLFGVKACVSLRLWLEGLADWIG